MHQNKAFIPYFVLYDKQLTPMAKLVYGELAANCDLNGVCKFTYREIAARFGVSIRTISLVFRMLREAGHIKTDGTKRIEINLPKKEIKYIVENRGEESYAKTI